MVTTIKLSHETVKTLAKRKKSPKESYEDVIKRLLSETNPLPLPEMLTRAYHYLKGRGVKNIRVFGSRLGEGQTPKSDLDLLIDLPDGVNLLDLVKMEQELLELLKVKVDLVPESALNPFMRDEILREARDILEVATG